MVVSQTFLWESVRKEWEATKWYQKLQHNILFWLQLLILILMIFALTQPFLWTKGVQGDQQIIIIDTSASMAATEGEKNRLELAKQASEDLLKRFHGHDVSFIEARKDPILHIQNDKNSALEIIESLELSYQKTDLNQALSLATSLIKENGSASIHIYTDQFASDMIHTDWDGPIMIHNLGQTNQNVSIESFGVANFDSKIQGLSWVTSESDTPVEATLRVMIGEQEVWEGIQTVSKEQPAYFVMEDLPHSTVYKATIEVDDAYELDNQLFSFLNQTSRPKIVVNASLHPFVNQALTVMGYEVVTTNSFTSSDESSIYIVENLKVEEWPDGPMMVINPDLGSDVSEYEINNPIEPSKGFGPFQYTDMDQVFISKIQEVNLSDFRPLTWSGNAPIFFEGEQNGNPVILVNFDIAQTDWPLHTSFPIFLYESIHYLTKDSEILGYFTPGEEQDVYLSETYQVLSEAQKIIKTHSPESQILQAPNKPGLYSLYNGENQYWFSVNTEEGENKIAPAQSFSIGETTNEEENMQTIGYPLANWLILIALFILVVEWEVYRRGS
ncbi:hypothetical protein GCM10008967_08720 [Bacillus carboniphilus]|uniref:VWFA domain-containing protein n=2 Tax=Bacillus carboniphilus TaxID=86663 RepID=A0ABP3FMV1_9BACI